MKITHDALVLVVEDSADLNTAICDILTSYGYRVHGTFNGYEALEYLRSCKPDVILCDIMMPGMDGYTLLRHTRADMSLRTLPFIFLTALSSSLEQRRAKEIGIDDFLTKPVDSSDLVAAIENALNRHRMMEEDAQRKLDDLRNRIVGLLQHEFRTPLTLVLGYAELIASTTPTNLDWDELRLSAAAILEGGRRLQALIESFLLLAALQNRTLHPGELERLDAGRLWEQVAQEFAETGRSEDVRLTLPDTPSKAYITGDEYLIRESLQRLLANILHHQLPADGCIRLSVVTLAPYVGLRVTSEGCRRSQPPGMGLLHPYRQNGQEELTGSGTGLNLTLVKQIARMHGGQLQAESTAGKGSAFTLWLPAAAPDTED
jgi:CheY-like chemotaxis protein